MANLSNWQDSLDERLVNRLTRPIRQPGMMKMAMGQRIINRCDRFLNRLPLLNQQMQRWGNTNTLSSESLPIVYAQPVSLVNNSQSTVSQVQSSANIIQTKLDSSQSLPINTVQNITDISSYNLADETNQFLILEAPINKTSISSPEVTVVSPQLITEQLPQTAEMALADLANIETSPPISSQSNLNHQSQPITTSVSSAEVPVVSPQPITEQLPQTAEMLPLQKFTSLSDGTLPIIQAKFENYSRPQLSVPIVNNLNNLTTDNLSSIKYENLISQISTKKLPIVTAQPLSSELNLTKQGIGLAINSPTSQNKSPTILNTQTVSISTSQINQPNRHQNISHLPLVSVTSPDKSSLKPQSSSLPLAKNTSSRSNSKQPNLSNPNSISTTNSSSSPRAFASSVSPIETSVSPIATQSNIDVDAIASQVERKLMRRLVIESERRGKNRWH